MIEAREFLGAGRRQGLTFYAGVPCSFLTPLINQAITDSRLDYVAAASEGEAVAIAAGAWLAGRDTVVMCQNSGLGNAVNPLTSLNYPFRIPTLLIVTWRAGPGLEDEPQHELMGKITPDLLDLMAIERAPFPDSGDNVQSTVTEACERMRASGLPYGLIMRKGDVAPSELEAEPPAAPAPGDVANLSGGERPARMAALERLLSVLPAEAVVIATTGKCGRELFTLEDRDQHLYQVGSMGCAAGMGLGVALNADNPVVVVDGDGALLMKMGTLGTIGAYGPKRLVHVVLDNGTYDSTGGQPTVSGSADFAAIAAHCGYRSGYRCDGLEGFGDAVSKALKSRGPSLIHMRILPGSMENLGRPTITPEQVARRLKAFIAARKKT